MDAANLPWHRDPETLGGTPIFKGTRVPVKSLLLNLAAGMSKEDFLRNYPTVESDQFDAAIAAFLAFSEDGSSTESESWRAA